MGARRGADLPRFGIEQVLVRERMLAFLNCPRSHAGKYNQYDRKPGT